MRSLLFTSRRPASALVVAAAAVLALATAAALALALAPSPARADVSGPDETPAQAYGPLARQAPVSGAFSGPSDQDYLRFVVDNPGQTLGFALQNTTTNCQDPYGAGCPVYLTLMDSSGYNQVGGPTSDAGTIATAGDSESFNWTFDAAGTYYILLESDGDLPAGSPSFTVGLGPSGYTLGGGAGTQSGGGVVAPPLIKSFRVARRQHGASVSGTLVLGRTVASGRITLLSGRRVLVARRLGVLRAGSHRLKLALTARLRAELRRRHRLDLRLRVQLTAPSGASATVSRPVTLLR